MKKAAFISLAFACLAPSLARSDDLGLPGPLFYYYSPDASASQLYVRCQPSSDTTIKCEFTKFEVTKGKAKADEDPSTVPDSEIKTLFASYGCSQLGEGVAAMASGKVPEGGNNAALVEKFLKKPEQART
jgi:hypothetical protein